MSNAIRSSTDTVVFALLQGDVVVVVQMCHMVTTEY